MWKKVRDHFLPNSEATYRLVYKKPSDTRIAPLTFKVSVPSDMSFVNQPQECLMQMQRTLTVSGVGLGSICWRLTHMERCANNGALVGTSVVTTAYVIWHCSRYIGEMKQFKTRSNIIRCRNYHRNRLIQNQKEVKVIGKSGDGIGFLQTHHWRLALIVILHHWHPRTQPYVAYKGDKQQ